MEVRAVEEVEGEDVDDVEEVRSMRWTLVREVDVSTGEEWEEAVEDEESLRAAREYLKQATMSEGLCEARGVVLAEDEHPGSLAAALRKTLVEEFEGSFSGTGCGPTHRREDHMAWRSCG